MAWEFDPTGVELMLRVKAPEPPISNAPTLGVPAAIINSVWCELEPHPGRKKESANRDIRIAAKEPSLFNVASPGEVPGMIIKKAAKWGCARLLQPTRNEQVAEPPGIYCERGDGRTKTQKAAVVSAAFRNG